MSESMKTTITHIEADGTKHELGEFDLEAPLPPGEVPQRVIDELCTACRIATDYSTAFSDACKAQAEKHKLAAGALKRYIKAITGDNLESVEKENDDLATLIAGRTAA